MIVKRLLDWIAGTVVATSRGGFFGAMANEYLALGAELWELSVSGQDVFFTTGARDYLSLHRLAKKHGCRVRVAQKRGLYFFLRRFEARWFWAAGTAAFIVALAVLGQFVFCISFRGEYPASESELRAALAKCGVREGTLINAIDIREAENGLLYEIKELSWTALNVSYGKAMVELRPQNRKTEEKTGVDASCLVARCDAVIDLVDVRGGMAAVKAGDVVKKGDALVVRNPLATGDSWTHNIIASIRGRTVRDKVFEIPKEEDVYTRNGSVAKRTFLTAFDMSVCLTPFAKEFELSETVTETRRLCLFGARLPFSVLKQRVYGLGKTKRLLTPEQARDVLDEKLRDYVVSLGEGAKLTKTEIRMLETDDAYIFLLRVFCTEEIGATE